MISGYLGKNDTSDKAIAAIGIAYADQTERSYGTLKSAHETGSYKS
jgi:hypothetical protein